MSDLVEVEREDLRRLLTMARARWEEVGAPRLYSTRKLEERVAAVLGEAGADAEDVRLAEENVAIAHETWPES